MREQGSLIPTLRVIEKRQVVDLLRAVTLSVGMAVLVGGCAGGAITLGLIGGAGKVREVEIEPANPTVPIGSVVFFNAHAVSVLGNPVPIRRTKWSSSDTRVGIFIGAGIFQALAVGRTQVEVKATTIGETNSARTLVTVELRQIQPGEVAALAIFPPQLQIPVGGSFQFIGVAVDATGLTIPDAELVYSLSGAVGELNPSTGFFQAKAVGDGTVTVSTPDGKTAVARVKVAEPVTPGQITAVVVYPSLVTVRAGAIQQFSALAMDGKGNFVSVPQFTWNADATLGNIDQSGRLTATTNVPVGPEGIKGTVTATADGARGAATVIVRQP